MITEKLSPIGFDWHTKITRQALNRIPDYMIDDILEYVLFGAQPSDFLEAVLCDSLVRSFGAADENNRHSMQGWATLLYNALPSECWGSEEKITAWVVKGGLEGQPSDKETS